MINRQKGKTLLRALPVSPSLSHLRPLTHPIPPPSYTNAVSLCPLLFPPSHHRPLQRWDDDRGDHLLLVVDRVPLRMAESLKADSFFGLNIVLYNVLGYRVDPWLSCKKRAIVRNCYSCIMN